MGFQVVHKIEFDVWSNVNQYTLQSIIQIQVKYDWTQQLDYTNFIEIFWYELKLKLFVVWLFDHVNIFKLRFY